MPVNRGYAVILDQENKSAAPQALTPSMSVSPVEWEKVVYNV
jgi:hypothetical protein